MATELGEYLVGAYLKLIQGCSVVDYNVRLPGGGLAGLGELDVIGFDFPGKHLYLCEVTTHLDGLQIGRNSGATISKLAEKHQRQQVYAQQQQLRGFTPEFMFWSPIVRPGLRDGLTRIGWTVVINEGYSQAIEQLRIRAKQSTADSNNPAFRVLQILEHLKPIGPAR